MQSHTQFCFSSNCMLFQGCLDFLKRKTRHKYCLGRLFLAAHRGSSSSCCGESPSPAWLGWCVQRLQKNVWLWKLPSPLLSKQLTHPESFLETPQQERKREILGMGESGKSINIGLTDLTMWSQRDDCLPLLILHTQHLRESQGNSFISSSPEHPLWICKHTVTSINRTVLKAQWKLNWTFVDFVHVCGLTGS